MCVCVHSVIYIYHTYECCVSMTGPNHRLLWHTGHVIKKDLVTEKSCSTGSTGQFSD